MKILVTGPYHTGKSSFVRKSTELFGIDKKRPAMSIDKNDTTVALDLGIVQIKGLKIYLFGTPGHLRFNAVRKVLSYGTDGIVFVLDPVSGNSMSEDSFNEFKNVWDEVNEYLTDVPRIICVNKQDLPNKKSIDVIKKIYPFISEYPIIPTSTKTGLNLEKAILTLVMKIIDQIKEPLKILLEFQGEVQGIEKSAFKLNKSIYETKKYLRWLERRDLAEIDWRLSIYWLCKGIERIIGK